MPIELPCGCKIYSSDTDTDTDIEDEDEDPIPKWKRLWQEENRKFVPTRASKSAEETLKIFNRIVLVGEAGCGKSAIARHIALKYERKGIVQGIVHVRNLSDIKKSNAKKKRVLFIIDDPIGRDVLDEKAFRSWYHQKKLLNTYLLKNKSGKKMAKLPKVIVTCRSNLITGGMSPFKKYEMIELDNELRKLTKDEKEQILKKHVGSLEFTDSHVENMLNMEMAFPSIAQMLSACESFKSDIVSFYKDPLTTTKKHIELLKAVSKEKYLCLFLLVLHGNQLSKSSFGDYKDLSENETEDCEGEETDSDNKNDNEEEDSNDSESDADEVCNNNSDDDDDVGSEEEQDDGVDDDVDVIDKNLLKDLFETIGISPKTSRKALLDCMKSIRGHYFVKHIERSSEVVRCWQKGKERVFKITNDAFLHILTVVFCEDIPDKFIKYCKSAFFRTMTTNKNQTKYFWSNVSLEDRFIDSFLDRVEKDVQHGVFLDAFLSQWYKDGRVQACLKKRLEAKPYEEMIKFVIMSKLHQDFELEQFPFISQTKVRGFARLDLISVCKEVSPIVLSLLLDINECFQTMFTLVKNGIDGTKYLNKAPLLSACCVNGRQDFARMILEISGKPHDCWSEHEGIYAIHIAANFLQSNILSIIVESVDDINLTTRRNQSPLFLAVAAGDYVLHCIRSNGADVLLKVDEERLKSIRLLVEKRANVNSHPEAFQSPLSISCAKNNMKITEILLQNNANVNEIGHGKKSPLHQAAKSGNHKLLHLLLDKGADVNMMSKYGFTPLYYATLNGHEGIVEILLSKGTTQELKEETGFSPFFVACEHGHFNLVKMFLQHDPFTNVTLPRGTSALMAAIDNGHTEIVKLLLDNGADIDIIRYENKISPLYLAAACGNNTVVKLLLKHGSAIDIETKRRCTPLIIASQNGHCSVAETLLDNGAKINFACNIKKTPLIYASENGRLDVVRLLLKRNADVNLCTKNGRSALARASSCGHNDVVSELLKHQANVNQQTAGGQTPLYLASENGHTGIVKKLLANKADIQIADKDGSTPLYIACSTGQFETVKELLIHDQNVDGRESLHPVNVASYKGYERIVQILIENGANVNLQGYDGCTPLIDASKKGWTEIVKILLDNGADHYICSDEGEDEMEMNALHHASARGNTDIVKLLLDHGMEMNSHTEYTDTPLQLALDHQRLATSLFLLEQGADANILTEKSESALYAACFAGFLEVVEILLKRGAEPNPKTGPAPLLGAIYSGHIDIVRILLDHGADTNYPVESIDCPTLLLKAVKGKDGNIVQLLLDHGAHVNTSSQNLITPLHADAYYCRDTDVMSVLLKHNADVNARSHNDQTPLMVMLEENTASEKRIKLLLSHGADLNLHDDQMMTALHYAANFNFSMVPILLQHGANPNAQDKNGNTALHGTGYTKSVFVVNALIKFGADVNIRNKKGLNSLDVAIEMRSKKVEKIIRQTLNARALEREVVLVKRHPSDSPSQTALPRRRGFFKIRKTWR